ncbi:hypothetical protein HK102_013432 [Quaeritorhiza haematococci]|nr:hypothetical protein HK102_013432 [Quaeritorhiza haematococci]
MSTTQMPGLTLASSAASSGSWETVLPTKTTHAEGCFPLLALNDDVLCCFLEQAFPDDDQTFTNVARTCRRLFCLAVRYCVPKRLDKFYVDPSWRDVFSYEWYFNIILERPLVLNDGGEPPYSDGFWQPMLDQFEVRDGKWKLKEGSRPIISFLPMIPRKVVKRWKEPVELESGQFTLDQVEITNDGKWKLKAWAIPQKLPNWLRSSLDFDDDDMWEMPDDLSNDLASSLSELSATEDPANPAEVASSSQLEQSAATVQRKRPIDLIDWFLVWTHRYHFCAECQRPSQWCHYWYMEDLLRKRIRARQLTRYDERRLEEFFCDDSSDSSDASSDASSDYDEDERFWGCDNDCYGGCHDCLEEPGDDEDPLYSRDEDVMDVLYPDSHAPEYAYDWSRWRTDRLHKNPRPPYHNPFRDRCLGGRDCYCSRFCAECTPEAMDYFCETCDLIICTSCIKKEKRKCSPHSRRSAGN